MSFNKDALLKLGTHEAQAKIAEAWFTFLGFSAVTAVFHAASIKADSYLIDGIKWVCYFLLFNWVYYKLSLLIWHLYPPSDPTDNRASMTAMGVSVWLASTVMLGVYLLSFQLFDIFVKVAQ